MPDETGLGRFLRQPLVNQTLSSGDAIAQDFRSCVRSAFFETDDETWPYAGNGGTLFVVRYKEHHYAVTCRHVLTNFSWRNLVVTSGRFGNRIAHLESLHEARYPVGAAVASDILDLSIIKLSCDASFFSDAAYVFDPGTIAISAPGDQLLINGALRERSWFDSESIAPTFALIEVSDSDSFAADRLLRAAVGRYENGIVRFWTRGPERFDP